MTEFFDRHEYSLVLPLMCTLCSKNVAGRIVRQRHLCVSCYTRLWKSGVFNESDLVDHI